MPRVWAESTALAEHLRVARHRLGLNESQFARRLKVPGSSLYRWCRGRDAPRPEQLARLGEELGSPLCQLAFYAAAVRVAHVFRSGGGRGGRPRGLGQLARRVIMIIEEAGIGHHRDGAGGD